ncbi:hypothetical protein [Pengzhenrongella frigida]|uniref:Uncharacterized protein n=1 Tax=Pengzhenrongella frigida TaxID=1259133 RepID=A0A4Q5N2E9_9MICO|nr:hypothetical protein [Cellulomonas sp. HLT2-17]RYV52295.1 hypothetical protein EUA98_03535 [Cellulomonas sp. HLT2-17]
MWFGIYVGSCLLVTAAAVVVAVLVGSDVAVIAVSVAAPVLFGLVGLAIFGIQPEDDDLVRIMAAG